MFRGTKMGTSMVLKVKSLHKTIDVGVVIEVALRFKVNLLLLGKLSEFS